MPAQKPAQNRAGLPYSMTLRLSSEQYRGLAFLAEYGEDSMADMVRGAIERYLASWEGGVHGQPKRNLLEQLQEDATFGLAEVDAQDYEFDPRDEV
jgi:hypothetical protein